MSPCSDRAGLAAGSNFGLIRLSHALLFFCTSINIFNLTPSEIFQPGVVVSSCNNLFSLNTTASAISCCPTRRCLSCGRHHSPFDLPIWRSGVPLFHALLPLRYSRLGRRGHMNVHISWHTLFWGSRLKNPWTCAPHSRSVARCQTRRSSAAWRLLIGGVV